MCRIDRSPHAPREASRVIQQRRVRLGIPHAEREGYSARHSAKRPSRLAFSLLEIILVMAVIAIASAISIPILNAMFSSYEVDRVGDRLQGRLAKARLRAIESGVPFAFVYVPQQGHYAVCALEPVAATNATSATVGAASTAVAGSGAYEVEQFQLAPELRFLARDPTAPVSSDLLTATTGTGLTATVDTGLAGDIAESRDLAALSAASRVAAASRLVGLNLPGATEAVVFYPDGTSDDAHIRVAHANGRYVELSVRGLTGTIQVKPSAALGELAAAEAGVSTLTPGPRLPGREQRVVPGSAATQ